MWRSLYSKGHDFENEFLKQRRHFPAAKEATIKTSLTCSYLYERLEGVSTSTSKVYPFGRFTWEMDFLERTNSCIPR